MTAEQHVNFVLGKRQERDPEGRQWEEENQISRKEVKLRIKFKIIVSLTADKWFRLLAVWLFNRLASTITRAIAKLDLKLQKPPSATPATGEDAKTDSNANTTKETSTVGVRVGSDSEDTDDEYYDDNG